MSPQRKLSEQSVTVTWLPPLMPPEVYWYLHSGGLTLARTLACADAKREYQQAEREHTAEVERVKDEHEAALARLEKAAEENQSQLVGEYKSLLGRERQEMEAATTAMSKEIKVRTLTQYMDSKKLQKFEADREALKETIDAKDSELADGAEQVRPNLSPHPPSTQQPHLSDMLVN